MKEIKIKPRNLVNEVNEMASLQRRLRLTEEKLVEQRVIDERLRDIDKREKVLEKTKWLATIYKERGDEFRDLLKLMITSKRSVDQQVDQTLGWPDGELHGVTSGKE